MFRRLRLFAAVVLLALPAAACSVLIGKVGNTLAGGSSTYSSDDDPDFVWEAVPFGLKTFEALIGRAPKNKNLLLAAASGFTEYGYGHIQQDADFIEATDLTAATTLRTRARKMYLRALEYGFRGLEVDIPGFRAQLSKDPKAAAQRLRKSQVPLIYWTAAAWGAAISISKNDPELTADQNLMEALMRRALTLDESWEQGMIHDFFITYEGARASVGGSVARAREHFERAMQLAHGTRVWPLVDYAETISVSSQNRKEFRTLLDQVLAFDVNKVPATRLSNLIAQRRAKWLLGRMDELFVE